VSQPRIQILPERCRGCKLCVEACPFAAIRMERKKAVIDYERCTLCGACVPICERFEAIVDHGATAAATPAGRCGEVWVFCELEPERGGLMPVSRELLGLAPALAGALGVVPAAVLFGEGLTEAARECIAYGARKVYVADAAALARYDDRRWSQVLAGLVRERRPEILLGGATALGRALLPRVAVELHTGLTADCTELRIEAETGLLLQTRPAFGGNILATITCAQHRPQMATVRPAVLPRPQPDPTRQGDIVPVAVDAAGLPPALEWLRFVPRGAAGVDLREAEVIVTAGFGVGGPEGVSLVAALATALGGVLGASRAVVDAGWLPYAHQVGQTGVTVQPKLYVACGVSGAIQHVVGMQNSATIVALNRDPEAPILRLADYAAVGDLFELIPALLRELRAHPP
jgi:caffeyl-CoA reductase-Etf complex subunit CarE